jgi:hypothetical protein
MTARFVPVSVVTMEPDPGEQLPEMVLDLGDHAAGTVPGGGLICEAPVADQRSVAGSVRVTHWMMPLRTREAPQEPAFLAGVERLWPGPLTS